MIEKSQEQKAYEKTCVRCIYRQAKYNEGAFCWVDGHHISNDDLFRCTCDKHKPDTQT